MLISFRTFLEEITDEQSRMTQRAATRMYKYLKPAFDAFATAKFRNGQTNAQLLPFIQQRWKTADRGNVFLLTAEESGMPMPIKVHITTNGTMTAFQWIGTKEQKQFGYFKLDLMPIQNAKDWREMSWAIQTTLGKLLHEPVHFFNTQHEKKIFQDVPPDTLSGGGNAQKMVQAKAQAAQAVDPQTREKYQKEAQLQGLLYMASDIEVEAYSHQFAMMYHRQYPFDEYDYNKMIAVVNKFIKTGAGRPDVNQNAKEYFHTMRKPEWQNYTDEKGNRPFVRAVQYMEQLMKRNVKSLLGRDNSPPRPTPQDGAQRPV